MLLVASERYMEWVRNKKQDRISLARYAYGFSLRSVYIIVVVPFSSRKMFGTLGSTFYNSFYFSFIYYYYYSSVVYTTRTCILYEYIYIFVCGFEPLVIRPRPKMLTTKPSACVCVSVNKFISFIRLPLAAFATTELCGQKMYSTLWPYNIIRTASIRASLPFAALCPVAIAHQQQQQSPTAATSS